MQISKIPMESLAEILALQMESGGIARLVVTGDSMYPTLRHHRDVVFLSSITQPLKKGDLILYQRDGGAYVLHRIVSKPKNGTFICCGDNQWRKEPVSEAQAIAIVTRFLRKGKQHNSETTSLRFWINFWILIFPLRRPILALRRCLGRIRRKCK